MIIILEGPDGSGKTTLSNLLTDELGVTRYHVGHVDMGSQFLRYLNLALDGPKPVVFDRFHISEMVYSALFRGESSLSVHQFYALEEILLDLGARLVHCTATNGTLTERHLARGDQDIKALKLPDQTAAFHYWAESSYLPTVTWTTTNMSPEALIERVVKA